MYQNNFLVSILHNGEEQREFSHSSGRKTVYLPLDSEYKILLRNNNSKRAKAEVFIDGKNICATEEGFIVDSYSSMRLERFVSDLKEGRKFKMVSSDHPDVQDPTCSENGLIRIKWYFEKEPYYKVYYPLTKVYPWNPFFPVEPWDHTPWIVWCSTNNSNYTSNVSVGSTLGRSSENANEKVATIEGSYSDQEFVEKSYEFESCCSADMVIKLIGRDYKAAGGIKAICDNEYAYSNFCKNCGKKINSATTTDKYCSNCGIKL